MDQPQHILVADNTSNGPSNTAFLLRLSGFSIREFTDELEACNWLLQIDPTLNQRYLLLLNEPKIDRALLALLFQMRQKFTQLDILLVSTEKLQLSGQITELNPPIYQCFPDAVHNTARNIFRNDEDHSSLQTSS